RLARRDGIAPLALAARAISAVSTVGAIAAGPRRRRSPMSIIAWIVFGLIAGFIASKIVNKSGEGALLDIVLGVVGAVVGGIVFNLVGATGVTGFNLWSMFVA